MLKVTINGSMKIDLIDVLDELDNDDWEMVMRKIIEDVAYDDDILLDRFTEYCREHGMIVEVADDRDA